MVERDGADRAGGAEDGRDRASEQDWARERRSFAARARAQLAAERERLARQREEQAERRRRVADRLPAGQRLADGSWDYRERARIARKNAAEHRVSAEASRQRAEAARQQAHDQHPLAARFAEVASVLFGSGDLDQVLARIVSAAVEVVDGVDVASITLLSVHGRISTPVASDPLARRLDELQYESGEGPCLEIGLDPAQAYLWVSDLAHHPRWPVFATMASAQGMHSVLSVGLFPHSHAPGSAEDRPRLGALNMYAREPRAFDHNARDVGLLLAAHASVALAGARTESQLREALDSRDVIGQAKGILMARRNLTAEQAFDVLRRTSQRLNIRLRDVAERIAGSGDSPD